MQDVVGIQHIVWRWKKNDGCELSHILSPQEQKG